jgi:hypothetical protein
LGGVYVFQSVNHFNFIFVSRTNQVYESTNFETTTSIRFLH